MKLSELLAERHAVAADGDTTSEAPALPTSAFGIEVDEEFIDFDPPPGIEEIGLVATFNSEGEFRDEVLDIAIAYKNVPKPVAVLLEIPHEENISDIEHVVFTAEGCEVSLSFLPPVELTVESFEAYCQRMELVAAAWASKINFSLMVLPVTSYFQHMIVELIDPEFAKSFVPDDPYIIERFHSRIPVALSDHLKARLRAVFKKSFTEDDGIDRFDETMIALCLKQLNNIEDITKEMAANSPSIAVENPDPKPKRKPRLASKSRSSKTKSSAKSSSSKTAKPAKPKSRAAKPKADDAKSKGKAKAGKSTKAAPRKKVPAARKAKPAAE